MNLNLTKLPIDTFQYTDVNWKVSELDNLDEAYCYDEAASITIVQLGLLIISLMNYNAYADPVGPIDIEQELFQICQCRLIQ